MEIEEVFGDQHRKILKANLPRGAEMPNHFATSDAFLIVMQGEASLIFDDRTIPLEEGGTFLIPERKPHVLKVKEDFKAYIILGPGAGIELVK